MTWSQADTHSCCNAAHYTLGPIGFEERGIHAHATCQNCGAESRDVFLDGYTEETDTRFIKNDWFTDGLDGCGPIDGGADDFASHEWGDWMFHNKGDRVQAERECQRCGLRHQHIYVYRYTEYDESTLPVAAEGDFVWYEPAPGDEEMYAEAEVVGADYDADEYVLRIAVEPSDAMTEKYGLDESDTTRVEGTHIRRMTV